MRINQVWEDALGIALGAILMFLFLHLHIGANDLKARAFDDAITACEELIRRDWNCRIMAAPARLRWEMPTAIPAPGYLQIPIREGSAA